MAHGNDEDVDEPIAKQCHNVEISSIGGLDSGKTVLVECSGAMALGENRGRINAALQRLLILALLIQIKVTGKLYVKLELTSATIGSKKSGDLKLATATFHGFRLSSLHTRSSRHHHRTAATAAQTFTPNPATELRLNPVSQ